MIRTLYAKYDGKALIPEEPLDLPPGTVVTLRFERVIPEEVEPPPPEPEWRELPINKPALGAPYSFLHCALWLSQQHED
jgi:hypothetical protein